jgi:hypothetical protein
MAGRRRPDADIPAATGGVAHLSERRHRCYPGRTVPRVLTGRFPSSIVQLSLVASAPTVAIISRFVTIPSSPPDPREHRLAEVTRAVRAVGDGSSDTRAAGRVRTALDTLLTHLVRAHDRCQDVADQDWADYRARLDIGLDDLRAEIARSTDPGDDGAELEKVLFVHCSRLELDGWRLHLDAVAHGGGRSADDRRNVQELVTYAARELDTYSRDGGATAEREADIDRIIESVRAETTTP